MRKFLTGKQRVIFNKEAQALRRKKEVAKAEGRHQSAVSQQLKQVPLLTPEQVTPERILQLRNEENLTIDVIAGRCSLSNLQVYNILQENA